MRTCYTLILTFILYAVLPVPAQAQSIQCTLVSATCSLTGIASTANGFLVTNVCLQDQATYSCVDSDPLDQCAPIEANSACSEVSRRCLIWQNSNCLREEVTYECFNDLSDYDPARLISTEFENYDAISATSCDSYQANTACTLATETCVTPASTQTIMGTDVTRQCWEWERTYLCDNGGSINTCTPFENDAACFESGSTCLDPGPSGSCTHESAEFTCGSNAPTNGQCQATQVCIGTLCDGTPDPPDDQFDEAMQWLHWMNDMVADKNYDPTLSTFDMFTGYDSFCRVDILNTANCCQDYGWALGWLGQCWPEEYQLMAAQDAGATTFVGSYCRNTILICVQTAYVYCVFNSALARVFQEQIRAQLGLDFGTPTSPDCGALTFAQLQTVDFTAIDLSDAFPYLTATTQPNAQQLTQSLISQFQQMTGQVDATFQ